MLVVGSLDRADVYDAADRAQARLGMCGAELQRWYWLKTELAALARGVGVSPGGGGEQQLTARLVAVLGGLPSPPGSSPQRGAPTARQLEGPLTHQTVIPRGQRCSQQHRRFVTTEIGRGFHFDGPMRRFIADGEGRTLGEAVDYWYVTRSEPRGKIGAQFELTRSFDACTRRTPEGTAPTPSPLGTRIGPCLSTAVRECQRDDEPT